jgi:hypothetical protein
VLNSVLARVSTSVPVTDVHTIEPTYELREANAGFVGAVSSRGKAIDSGSDVAAKRQQKATHL